MDDLKNIVVRRSTRFPELVGFSEPGFWAGSKELADCTNPNRDDNAEVARRFVVCWNKFIGVPTDDIEKIKIVKE